MTPSSASPYTVHGELPLLDSPTLIIMMSGWIDASGAAAGAMQHLINATASRDLINFDGDTFVDYRARRPLMELREGVNTRIVWSVPEMRVGTDDDGRDVLLLTGPEPDMAWHYFAKTVATLATQLGVKTAIGMGAYPFGAPHTRPVGLSATSPDAAIAERLSLTRSTVDVPAGVEAILEHSLTDAGITAIGLWAQIPHYVATMAYPAASAALVEAACLEAGLTIDTSALRKESGVQRERLDQLVAGNPEHAEMLGKLEAAYDAEHGSFGAMKPDATAIPTVDEIAAEVEQFLRDQQTGG
ncbi:MAG: PAC2 family protein [Actinobacteria bacterium]|nr:PAC2 family protein [Actinomycetota bacterium]